MASSESPEVPGLLRNIVKVWAAFSALVCIGFSIFVMITLTSSCFAMGALMITCGLSVLLIEAPILCFKIEVFTKLSKWVEDHLRFWMKATIYLCMALPPIVVCPEASTFLGSGAVIITAALYGVMAIGKKGQASSTVATKDADVEMKESLVDSKGDPKDLGSPS